MIYLQLPMEHLEVIVIGAGAAGLMAAYTLAKAGKKVLVLEARGRTGGRIHTLDHASFFTQAELGAEFVHGNLPLTLSLLKDAGLDIEPSEGEMWQYLNGKFSENSMMNEDWDELMDKLNSLQQDITMTAFLNQYFADDKYESLRASVIRYLAGFDTGDPDLASAFALRDEWQHEDEDAQYRIKQGYCALISHLVSNYRSAGGAIYLNEPVKTINWKANEVTVTTQDGKQYEAQKVIVAVALGVLQQPKDAVAAIQFNPTLPEHSQAFQQIGFGDLVKVLLRFDEIFWEKSPAGDDLKDMAFLFSKEFVPTWWTQAPNQVPIITGWLAGPPAAKAKHITDEEMLEKALQSLAHIFNYNIEELKGKLIASHIANWSAEPYTCGSYAYDMVASPEARQLLNKGVEQTVFFAGEYLYAGPAMGTVEAALMSGQQAANYIL